MEGEENLLAIYLHRGRTFPSDLPDEPIREGLWDQFKSNAAVRRKIEADRVSYNWDRLLEHFCGHALAGTFEFGKELAEHEEVLREMARESRVGRRFLAESFAEFADLAQAGELRARATKSIRGVGYVFMNARPSMGRNERQDELGLRCFVARGELDCATVIGICFNLQRAPLGYSEDLMLLRIPEWTGEHARQAAEIKTELGFFAKPLTSSKDIDEYPPAGLHTDGSTP